MSIKSRIGLFLHETKKSILRNEKIYVKYCWLLSKLKGESYEQFYARTMDIRSVHESFWGLEDDNIKQKDYLVKHGVTPDMSVLDYGCGSLAAGRFIIPYLEKGCYCGADISSESVALCKVRVKEWGLEIKEPELIWIENGSFESLKGKSFDVIWAQSVLTHCPENIVENILKNTLALLRPNGRVIMTFHSNEEKYYSFDLKNFSYPIVKIEAMARKVGGVVEIKNDFSHPNPDVANNIRVLHMHKA